MMKLSKFLLFGLAYNSFSSTLGSGSNALVVLGGGVAPDGTVPLHTEYRLRKAIELYTRYKSGYHDNDVHIITLSNGTPHKPNPTDSQGFPISESNAAVKYLLASKQVDPNDNFEENTSLDTLGNAYFLRAVHLDPGHYDKVSIITSSFHIQRARAMFELVLALPAHKGASWFGSHNAPSLEFISTEAGLAEDILKSRIIREAASLKFFQSDTRHQFSDFESCRKYIFQKHKAYHASRLLGEEEKALSKAELASY